jgi:hypothetical protein
MNIFGKHWLRFAVFYDYDILALCFFHCVLTHVALNKASRFFAEEV